MYVFIYIFSWIIQDIYFFSFILFFVINVLKRNIYCCFFKLCSTIFAGTKITNTVYLKLCCSVHVVRCLMLRNDTSKKQKIHLIIIINDL